jgi:glyoxylase-like metal-dependent hydrolase (beta-lactamase superfamily II)
MRIVHHVIAVALATAGLTACSSTPTTRQLAQDAVTAMGGTEKLRSIQTLVMKDGTGTRMRLGQTVRVGDQEMPAQLTKVVEIADLANGRASLDYELRSGDFTQHRHEILTKLGEGAGGKPVGIEIVGTRPIVATAPSGLFSWGTQNSPEFLLRRNVVSIVLAAAETGAETAAIDKDFNGQTLKYGTAKSRSGEEVGLFFDPNTKLLMGFEVTDTETILGDVPAQYILADYKAVDGISLPHTITIRKGGQDYSDVQFASIAINDPAAQQTFAIPEAAAKEAEQAAAMDDYSPVAITKIAEGLHFVRAYSHNSMLVEFPKFLALVEAPYTEAQSKTLARVVQEQFPGKPIQYAAVTHHHYDHTGGVRGIAAIGATILVEKGHEPALRAILEAPHTNPADELAARRAAQQPTGSIEVYEGKKVIADGGQSLELHAITGSPHVDPMVVAYVPKPGALFQSDLFFPGTGGNFSPEAQHLLESVRKLGLRVTTNVGGHGGVGKFDELVKAGTPPAAKTN